VGNVKIGVTGRKRERICACALNLTGSGRPVAGFCKRGKDLSGSINVGTSLIS